MYMSIKMKKKTDFRSPPVFVPSSAFVGTLVFLPPFLKEKRFMFFLFFHFRFTLFPTENFL